MINQHKSIIIAFSIPLLLIVGIVVFAYLPTSFVSTDYGFVYAFCQNDSYREPTGKILPDCASVLKKRFTVTDGKVHINEVADTDLSYYDIHLFSFDSQTKKNREVAVADIASLSINNSLISPDGVSVQYQNGSGANFFPFVMYENRDGYYFVDGDKREKISLFNDESRYYYGNEFLFLGWIIK